MLRYERAQEIQEQALGPGHPEVASTLNNRASLLQTMVRLARSLRCCRIIWFVGSANIWWQCQSESDVKAVLIRALLTKQGRYAEAEAVYKRSQTIQERSLGAEHPGVAQSLNNRADLLETQVCCLYPIVCFAAFDLFLGTVTMPCSCEL